VKIKAAQDKEQGKK